MSRDSSWRSPAAAHDFTQHDYPDFAQEFLRRNADYRRDYRRIARRVANGTMSDSGASQAVRKWGLVFRMRS
jgi:hypothetical protein